jgi:RNA polymerase sigma-70 factor (ECF subfamily)
MLSESVDERASADPVSNARSEFEAVFLQHYTPVLRLLIRFVGSRAQAEDLANEVFWKLSRQSEDWMQTNNVGGWLYRTATRAGIDALRATTHRRRYEFAATWHSFHREPGGAGPLESVLREEDRQSVRLVLSKLKPAQAQLLLLRADGLSYKELAEALDVAVTGIGTLLTRAETEFRKHYAKLMEKRNPL